MTAPVTSAADRLGTEPVSEPITAPYKPEERIGEWGWLWEEGDGKWMLIATVEGDEGTPEILTDVWDADGISNEYRGHWDASKIAGKPYLSLSEPGCDPGAGLLVLIHLPEGAFLSHSWGRPCAAADQAREAVLAALMPGKRDADAKDAEIARLRAERDRLRSALSHLADMASSSNSSLNSTRLIMPDKESRDLAGAIVDDTNKAIREALDVLRETAHSRSALNGEAAS